MNKQIYIINGSGGVGKDTFVKLVADHVPTWNYSSVTKVKEIAKKIGWTGSKAEKDRKFLSDLKILTSEFCDMSFKSLQEEVLKFNSSDDTKFLFLHIREPEEIKRAVDEFEAKTILIRRDSVEHITSNISDKNVFNYKYDVVINNNGTIDDLNKRVKRFIKDSMVKPKLYLDFDGTLMDTIACITKMYNDDFSAYSKYKFIHPCQVNSWDFKELSLASKNYIDSYFNQPRFFENIEYMDNAEEVINVLRNSYKIIIVSSGYSPNLRLKRKWIEKNMPYAEFIGVNLKNYQDKSCVDMSDGIFIDDSYNNLITSNAFKKICFGDDYPWNKEWNGIKCRNWKDVERYLEKGVTV